MALEVLLQIVVKRLVKLSHVCTLDTNESPMEAVELGDNGRKITLLRGFGSLQGCSVRL